MKQERVFDVEAVQRTMDSRFVGSDPYTDKDVLEMVSEMKPYEQGLDSEYKQIIKSEYEQAKSMEKIITTQR